MNSKLNNTWLALKNIRLLYVEDDLSLRNSLTDVLRLYFSEVYTSSNGIEGLENFRKRSPDIVITDIKMPGMDGIKMAFEIKRINRSVPVIVTTAFTEIPDLINAIEAGVDKYIQKPINIDKLLETLYDVSLPFIQQEKISFLQKQNSLEDWYFGRSPQMRNIFEQAKSVACSPFSIVLSGETGSGKSFLAKAIHDISDRKEFPFIKIDLGTMPENLIESELFGYEKGAFTGAEKKRKGFFEAADRGTVFLDELENASLHFQSRLLRVVEEKKIVPVGTNIPVETDIRIISATNKNLYELVKRGQFREDLYYRLAEFEIFLPPLRERKDDIPWLASRFLLEAADELKKTVCGISTEAEEYLVSLSWNGNVRELRNVIRRAALFSKETVLSLSDINCAITTPLNTSTQSPESNKNIFRTLAQNEQELICNVLDFTQGNKTKAAAILGIDITTLRRKLKRTGA